MAQVNGVDLQTIEDETMLYKLLDGTEDFDERKKIRNRLKEVQAINRAKRDEMIRKREDEREQAIRQRFQEAAEQKRRTLAMYDQMAKSAPAGGKKVMDINIYKNSEGTDATPVPQAPERDLVEEGIQQRHKEAEDRKRRILAAYDSAAKSGPPGPKIVDLDVLPKTNESTPAKPTGSCTVSISGGVPQIGKDPVTSTIRSPEEVVLDAMQRDIRARQMEAEERKRKTLAAYDMIARSGGGGPQFVCLEDYLNMDVLPQPDDEPALSSTASFRGGVAQLDKK